MLDCWDLCYEVFDICLDIISYECNYCLIVFALVVIYWYVMGGMVMLKWELFVRKIGPYVICVKCW